MKLQLSLLCKSLYAYLYEKIAHTETSHRQYLLTKIILSITYTYENQHLKF